MLEVGSLLAREHDEEDHLVLLVFQDLLEYLTEMDADDNTVSLCDAEYRPFESHLLFCLDDSHFAINLRGVLAVAEPILLHEIFLVAGEEALAEFVFGGSYDGEVFPIEIDTA